MSHDPKILAGSAGTVADQATSAVVHMFWSRNRVTWGEEVTAGALISGYKDGTKVKLKVFEDDGDPAEDDPVTDLDCKLDKGFAKKEWKVEFQDPDGSEEGGEYEFYFVVEIKGEVISQKAACPLLFLDLLPPEFSI